MRASPTSSSSVRPCRVLDVDGLTVDTTEEQLKAFLSCSAVDIPKDRRSGLSMGYGYAYFSTTELATHALSHFASKELNGNRVYLRYTVSRHPDRLDAIEAERRHQSPHRSSHASRSKEKGACMHYPNCKKGDRCGWLHLDSDGRDRRFEDRFEKRRGSDRTGPRVHKPCAHYPNCLKGDACDYEHLGENGRDVRLGRRTRSASPQNKKDVRDRSRESYRERRDRNSIGN